MKTLSKLTIVTFAATLFMGIASAQALPPHRVLDDLTAEQVTMIKQLGHISQEKTVDPLYDLGVASILTPEQHYRYEQQKHGPKNTFNTNDFPFNMDSK